MPSPVPTWNWVEINVDCSSTYDPCEDTIEIEYRGFNLAPSICEDVDLLVYDQPSGSGDPTFANFIGHVKHERALESSYDDNEWSSYTVDIETELDNAVRGNTVIFEAHCNRQMSAFSCPVTIGTCAPTPSPTGGPPTPAPSTVAPTPAPSLSPTSSVPSPVPTPVPSPVPTSEPTLKPTTSQPVPQPTSCYDYCKDNFHEVYVTYMIDKHETEVEAHQDDNGGTAIALAVVALVLSVIALALIFAAKAGKGANSSAFIYAAPPEQQGTPSGATSVTRGQA